MPETIHLSAAGHHLEAVWHCPPPEVGPTIVMLHEGLGCVAGWRDWPAIEHGVGGPFSSLILPACGHSPQKDRPDETTAAIVDLVRRAFG